MSLIKEENGVVYTTYEHTNRSTAKQKFSFPKCARFKQSKPAANDLAYDLPITRTKKTCSFGIGRRFGGMSQSSPRTNGKLCFYYQQALLLTSTISNQNLINSRTNMPDTQVKFSTSEQKETHSKRSTCQKTNTTQTSPFQALELTKLSSPLANKQRK